ncbi:glutamine synthetase-like [Ylistrum balloti]|uniref:glutamine synthetase-like n=1 Tax=Ylistrum balloti TaxID=509963 RepID=UPI002905D6A5|nr:glutamine synthetase-like [Ylistrum balloti]
MNSNELMSHIKENNIEYVDIQFGDIFGRLHHITLIAKELDEGKLEEGIPFDGSSIRAWQGIEKSDMLFIPDLKTMFIDPFRSRKTLILYGDIVDPRTGELYNKSPRSIAKRASEYLKSTGTGDKVFFGPEPEFFLFDSANYEVSSNRAMYEVDTSEGPWNSGLDIGAHGNAIQAKEGYLPSSPQDSCTDLRSEITSNMQAMGLTVYLHHHEVATAQAEIGVKFDEGMYSGDIVHKYKYAVKNTAHQHGKTATFMPKTLFGDNGSGMHVHMSIWKEEKNLFAGDKYANLSQTALYAIGGLLKHGRALQAFTNPTVNSFRRLVPGYEAPVRLAYSAANRSAAIRIPYVKSEKARRFEFRCGDASGSPYLSFAALTMAMIDGIRNQVDPGDAMDRNIYDLPPEQLKGIPSTCQNLEEALDEMVKSKDFLTAGDVFSEDFIDSYVSYKKENEIEPMKLYPTALEYQLYYTC